MSIDNIPPAAALGTTCPKCYRLIQGNKPKKCPYCNAELANAVEKLYW